MLIAIEWCEFIALQQKIEAFVNSRRARGGFLGFKWEKREADRSEIAGER